MKNLKSWKRGSFTAEASCLLPVLLLILFAFLCLSLYLHDRVILSACAAELTGKAAACKYETEEHLKSWLDGQAQDQAEERLLILRNIRVSSEVTGQKVTLRYTGYMPLLGGFEVQEEETAKRLNPAEFVRGVRQVQGTVQKERG